MLGKQSVENKVINNLHSPLYGCIIHAPKPAKTSSTSNFSLDNLLGRAPANSEIVMGADVNSNIGKHNGIHSTEFCTVLGPHGLAKRNMKGESLLHIYLAHQLRVMNRSQVVQDIALG